MRGGSAWKRVALKSSRMSHPPAMYMSATSSCARRTRPHPSPHRSRFEPISIHQDQSERINPSAAKSQPRAIHAALPHESSQQPPPSRTHSPPPRRARGLARPGSTRESGGPFHFSCSVSVFGVPFFSGGGGGAEGAGYARREGGWGGGWGRGEGGGERGRCDRFDGRPSVETRLIRAPSK